MRYVSVSVDAEVYVGDVLELLDEDELAQALRDRLKQGISVPLGLGDGDTALAHNTIERAFLAAKRMPEVPHEIADLFWHVHGRAL